MVLGEVARLPVQVRQGGGEVDGVLAGAGADFQDVVAMGEVLAEDGEDRVAVARGGRGVRQGRGGAYFNFSSAALDEGKAGSIASAFRYAWRARTLSPFAR